MNLPNVVTGLIEAQNNQDSKAYAESFSETATVKDEGETHVGRHQIQAWISKANETYKATMTPVEYKGDAQSGTLAAKISGNFPGSPITLRYQLKFEGGLVRFLSIGD